jgi:putative heme-binding domain-containing protein
VVPAIIAVLHDGNAPRHAKWHAIWTLDGIDAGKGDKAIHEAIVGVLADSGQDVSVRMQAARELGTRKVEEAVPALVNALNEDNEALRFRAATALGRIADVSAVRPLLEKLGDHDLFTHYSIFHALNRIARAHPEAWQPIVDALAADSTEQREGAALAMHETYDPQLVKLLAAFAESTAKPADARAAAIAALAPLQKQRKAWEPTATDLKWWRTMPARDPAPPKDVEWAGTKAVMDAIRTALNDESDVVRHAAVQGLRVAPDPSVSDRLAKLFETDHDQATRKAILAALASAKAPSTAKFVDEVLANAQQEPTLVTPALEAAEKIGGPDMTAAVVKFVDASGNKPEQTIDALKTLAKLPDVKSLPVLTKKLNDANNGIVNAAADAIGAISDDKAVDAVAPFLKGHRDEVKRAAANALGGIKRPRGNEVLLAVWHDKSIQREAILAMAGHPEVRCVDAYLDGLGMADGNVRGKCRRAIEAIHEKALPVIEERLDTNPPSAGAVVELQKAFERYIPKDKRDEHKLYKFDTKSLSPEAFLAYAHAHSGDAGNGKRLFHDANGVGCIKCHKVGSEGGDVGPSLDGVGTKYPREFLIESILYPSKQILDGYQQTIIKRKSTNQVDYYIVRSENDTELTAVASDGTKTVIKKDDILSRRVSNVSMMPEGLQAALKPEEFADVVAYLETLKEPQKK